MWAACAPATATSPAAVPSRRLFTIFISTSICCRGRIGLRRALLTLEGPLSSPSRPVLPVPLFVPLGHRPHRTERHRDAPLRRPHTISSRVPAGNGEEAFWTLPNSVSGRVLPKQHSAPDPQKQP